MTHFAAWLRSRDTVLQEMERHRGYSVEEGVRQAYVVHLTAASLRTDQRGVWELERRFIQFIFPPVLSCGCNYAHGIQGDSSI